MSQKELDRLKVIQRVVSKRPANSCFPFARSNAWCAATESKVQVQPA